MHDDTFTEFTFEGFKNSSPIICNSQPLLNYLIFLEWDPAVKSYFQPGVEITVDFENKKHSAKIELWIEYHDRKTELVQFLDREWIEHFNDNPLLYTMFENFCQSRDCSYMPINVDDSENEALISNLNLLWNNARREIKMTHVMLINNFFAKVRETNLGRLTNVLINADFGAELIYTLIFHKLILADILYFPLSEKTTVLAGYVHSNSEKASPILIIEKLNSIIGTSQTITF